MRSKKIPINEKDIRLHFRFLNHKYLTELRLLRKGMYPAFRIVKDEDKFVAVCKQWNGKRNIYVGLRDRGEGLKSCARTEDIIGLQSVVLDIDPIRETETSSTKKELDSAIEMSKIIKKWFIKNTYNEPYIAVTGNGCCLYFIVPFYEIRNENRFEITRKIEAFEHYIRNNFKKELKTYNCIIDRMYDLPRIIRVIGTYNIKGTSTRNRPWRISYWLEKPKYKQENLSTHQKLQCGDKKLLKFILPLKPT